MEEEDPDDMHIGGARGLQAVIHSAAQLPYNVAVGLADEVAFQMEGMTPERHHGNADIDTGQLYHESPSQMHQSHQHDSDEPIDLASGHFDRTAASASSLKAAQHDHTAQDPDERTTLSAKDLQVAEQRQGGSPKKCVTIQEDAEHLREESKGDDKPQPVAGRSAPQAGFDERLSETSSVSHPSWHSASVQGMQACHTTWSCHQQLRPCAGESSARLWPSIEV